MGSRQGRLRSSPNLLESLKPVSRVQARVSHIEAAMML